MGVEDKEVVAPQPGTPEHDAAMAAKVDESATKALEAANGNELEAPKDAPAEAPAEGEQKPEEKADEDKPEGDDGKALEDAAKEAVEAQGIVYDDLQKEFDEKGELSQESYDALAKVGFPKEIVDGFIEGQKALAAQVVAKGIEAAGGEAQFSQMQEWAKNSLTAAELDAYNKAVATGTQEEMLQAVRGLRSSFETEYGRQPQLLGGAPAGASNMGYASRAEMTADMKDPRYAKDPAFRAKVTAKIAATTAF